MGRLHGCFPHVGELVKRILIVILEMGELGARSINCALVIHGLEEHLVLGEVLWVLLGEHHLQFDIDGLSHELGLGLPMVLLLGPRDDPNVGRGEIGRSCHVDEDVKLRPWLEEAMRGGA